MAADEGSARILARGLEAFRAGDYVEARRLFSQAVLLAPDDRVARFHLGASQFHLGNVSEARRHLELLRGGPPPLDERPAALPVYLSRCALGSDASAALALAREAIACDPDDPLAHLAEGHAHRRLGWLDKALADYDRAWQLEGGPAGSPGSVRPPGQVPLARAEVLLELRRWPEALEAIEQAIAREPGSALAFDRKGLILVAAGRPDDAVTHLRRAVELDPETRSTGRDGAAYFHLASTLAQLGRREEALEACDRALALSPQPHYRTLRTGLEGQLAIGRRVLPLTTSGAAVGRVEHGVPTVNFSHVGGMHALKNEVRRIVDTIHAGREQARRYGIVRNGILLYGPSGCGKTFFARAIAGEFNLRFIGVSLGDLVRRNASGSPDAIERVFVDARAATPCLLFFDEFDAIAQRRSNLPAPAEQQAVNTLLQQLETCREVPGLVLVAATNRFNELDPAVIREGRFDYKVKVYKPDFDARQEILQVLLAGRPCESVIDAAHFAHLTEGLTAAQLRSVVDAAALRALETGQVIGLGHLEDALREFVTAFRYGGRRLTWSDLVLPEATLARLQFLERVTENVTLASELGIEAPSGVLLHGPPGTGKTTIARVIASEIEASFFAMNAADINSKWLGESEQHMRQVFERARDQVPAIVFMDEVDAILGPRGDGGAGMDHAGNAVLATFLSEMDGLDSTSRVMVIGATNRLDLVDPAVVRPGRLGEVIEIGLPDGAGRRAMLGMFTGRMRLSPDTSLDHVAEATEGASGADLRGLCTAAGRHAFLRELEERDDDVAVTAADFAHSLDEFHATLVPERARAIGF